MVVIQRLEDALHALTQSMVGTKELENRWMKREGATASSVAHSQHICLIFGCKYVDGISPCSSQQSCAQYP